MEFGIPWDLLWAGAVPPIVQAIRSTFRPKAWVVPLLAITCGLLVQGIGAGMEQLAVIEGDGAWQPVLGAMLGLLGVGLRELTVSLIRREP